MIEIVPATMEHVRRINLRPGDAAEIAALGVTKEEGLRKSLSYAIWADAYIADGEVAAILGFGMSCMVGGHGTPWLITGEPVDRHRKAFLRLTKERVGQMRAAYPLLVNYVHAEYTASLRWMRWLGFTVGPPQPVYPTGALFCRVSIGDPDGH